MFSREFSAIFHTTKEEPSLKVSVFVMSVGKNVSKISKYCFLIGRLGSSLLVGFFIDNFLVKTVHEYDDLMLLQKGI